MELEGHYFVYIKHTMWHPHDKTYLATLHTRIHIYIGTYVRPLTRIASEIIAAAYIAGERKRERERKARVLQERTCVLVVHNREIVKEGCKCTLRTILSNYSWTKALIIALLDCILV